MKQNIVKGWLVSSMVGVRLFATSRYRSTHITEVHNCIRALFFSLVSIRLYFYNNIHTAVRQ